MAFTGLSPPARLGRSFARRRLSPGTRRIGSIAASALQHSRIHQGVASGELTRHEAHSLAAGQRHVERVENRATADGVVTGKERAHLEYAQDRQSARIYNLKHNDRTRD